MRPRSSTVNVNPSNFTSPSQISGQDTFIQKVITADGKTYEFSSTAGFVFVTHPLPVRYKIHEGDDWTSFFNAERTAATYNRVSTGGEVWFEILRPQRLAVEGEVMGFRSLAASMYLAQTLAVELARVRC